MRVMHAGDGYRYLLSSVAAGDGNRALSTPLTRYYAEAGTPPGRWLGTGLSGLGDGRIRAGMQVTEAQLQALLGEGLDPVTDGPLGRPYRQFAAPAERAAVRVARLDAELAGGAREAAAARIEAEEQSRGRRHAVAGFDFTVSIPKSASVLWAVADAATQRAIVEAHHAAVGDVLAFLEREVAETRVGAEGDGGGVAQMPVEGLIATAFDHFDSRAGDPHLHTHVVVANRVRTLADEQWRTLDGRGLHSAVVALSELHQGLFADRLTATLGVGWEARARGRDRAPSWSIVGVPDQLIAAFSTRSAQIDRATDELIAAYIETRGRRPTRATIIALRAQATLATRPVKQIRPLADLTVSWRATVTAALGSDATGWARSLVGAPVPASRASTVSEAEIEAWAGAVLERVEDARSTWRRWNLLAEAARQTMGVRFESREDREAVLDRVVTVATDRSMRLTPPDATFTPPEFRREDGSSRFRPLHGAVYSSQPLLDAEDRLVALAGSTDGPRLPAMSLDRHMPATAPLSPDQAAAVSRIARSGRVVDVLLGPAGSGKTSAMRGLRAMWEHDHGPGSVIGLAPSAAAAEVLATDLGIGTENTAKWIHEQNRRRTGFAPGQLVILDEASLAGTRTLATIAEHADARGAKLLLVGDDAQLQAVDAGGAFALLARSIGDPPRLTEVHRFRHDWEKTASLLLRRGDPAAVDAYAQRGRIVGGDAETAVDAAYRAWRSDLAAGGSSILIADSTELVRDLNTRARTDRLLDGTVHGRSARLHDGTDAGAGDAVVTRRNDRRLRTGSGWVRNGDRWTVESVHRDGSVTVRRADSRPGRAMLLPAAYVRDHLELAYAITTHRAQGITVDTAHSVLTSNGTREAMYVALTRGREANTAYVITDDLADEPRYRSQPTIDAARTVLTQLLARTGSEQSAHATIAREQNAWQSIRQLAAEYDTLASAAQRPRWDGLVRASVLSGPQQDAVLRSDACGALYAAFRRLEAHDHDVAAVFDRVILARPLDEASDPAALLLARTRRIIDIASTRSDVGRSRMIVGLIPEASGVTSPAMAEALESRRALIEQRTVALVETAIERREPWIDELGARPTNPVDGATWDRSAALVAAYRDRYGVTASTSSSTDPVGTDAQQRDHRTILRALRRAQVGSGSTRQAVRTAVRQRDNEPTLIR